MKRAERVNDVPRTMWSSCTFPRRGRQDRTGRKVLIDNQHCSSLSILVIEAEQEGAGVKL